MVKLIDGKALANTIQEALRDKVQRATQSIPKQRAPFLAVVLVGDDPASKVYVQHKEKACAATGIHTQTFTLAASTSQHALLELITKLNTDDTVDGILVQLPLPAHIERMAILQAIAPGKDVDGLGPVNQGLLALNLSGLVPCTPLGIMKMLASLGEGVAGKLVAVVGRSPLVGAPLVRLLTHQNATVINIHSHTPNPEKLAKLADILVAAAGVPHLIDASWVKKGATVIDVGIHRGADGKLSGDVDFAAIKDLAHYCSPVPGGVGPMTIACLLSNCVQAYEARQNLHQGNELARKCP